MLMHGMHAADVCVPSLRAALWTIGSLTVMLLMAMRVSYGVPHLWAAEESFRLMVTSRTKGRLLQPLALLACTVSSLAVFDVTVTVLMAVCAAGEQAGVMSKCGRLRPSCNGREIGQLLAWRPLHSFVLMVLNVGTHSLDGALLQPSSRSVRWLTAASHAAMLSHTADRAQEPL